MAEGEAEEALDRFNTIATRYRRSETCALALWEIYRIQEHLDSPEAAFEALNRLATEQPGHFEKAHAAQLILVRRLLGAGKEARRTLEAPRASQVVEPEVIAAMLSAIIKSGPQSEVGIQARYHLALAQEKAGERKEAQGTYEDFAETYPKHELADDAGYQAACIAYKNWQATRGTGPRQRDAAAVALAWFIARFPESDKAAQARSCLAEVRHAEQRELISLARYYESRDNATAASYYYQQLALKFPEMAAAESPLREKIAKAIEPPELKAALPSAELDR